MEFHKACQVPFRVPRGKVSSLCNCCSIKGPPQQCRGEFRGLSGCVAGSLGFQLSCVSTWDTCSCLLSEVRSLAFRGAPLDSSCIAAGMNRASSQVEAGTSGFLSISADWNTRVTPPIVLRNGTPLASGVLPRVTGHLSSCIWNLHLFPDNATGVSFPLVL